MKNIKSLLIKIITIVIIITSQLLLGVNNIISDQMLEKTQGKEKKKSLPCIIANSGGQIENNQKGGGYEVNCMTKQYGRVEVKILIISKN